MVDGDMRGSDNEIPWLVTGFSTPTTEAGMAYSASVGVDFALLGLKVAVGSGVEGWKSGGLFATSVGVSWPVVAAAGCVLGPFCL